MPSSSSSSSSPHFDLASLSVQHQTALLRLLEALAQSEAKCASLETQLRLTQTQQGKKLKKALIQLKTLQSYIHVLHQERRQQWPLPSPIKRSGNKHPPHADTWSMSPTSINLSSQKSLEEEELDQVTALLNSSFGDNNESENGDESGVGRRGWDEM